MEKSAVAHLKLDRALLAIYLFALWGLLMFPIAGPQFRFLGIGADKWMHVVLFGGLAVILRWNLSANQRAVLVTVSAAFVVAGATEIAQSLVTYRSAELWDLLAGLVGATLGAVSMDQIVSSPVPEKLAGLIVTILGLMVGALFVLADVVTVGTAKHFGTLQLAGAVLGALVAAGGVWLYVMGLRGESRP